MNVRDIFGYAFGSIRLRKLRAGLTTLGIVIGIAAIVALLSITQGLQLNIADQLQTGLATDTLLVSAGGGFDMGFGGTSSDFKLLVNYTQLIDEIEDVELSIAIIQRSGFIQVGDDEFHFTIVGVNYTQYVNVYSTTFVAEKGTIPLNPTNETIVVGSRINNPWNNGTILIDVNDSMEVIWQATYVPPITYKTYVGNVSAILQEIGGFSLGGPTDRSIYIPLSNAQNFFGTDECDRIIVKVANDDEATIDRVSDTIEDLFSDQVSITSLTAILDLVASIFSTMEIFLLAIAAISLLVAGIGIMNIMVVSLMERTREIGILKALGMKSRAVLSIFLSEAVLIGVMGALFGLGSGWLLATVVALVFRGGVGFMGPGTQGPGAGQFTLTPVITPMVFLGAFVFGIVVSVVFALYPAWRAARLKPVEALRYE